MMMTGIEDDDDDNDDEDYGDGGEGGDGDDVDDECPFSEKQVQWLTLQFWQVTVGETEWIECNRLNYLF